MFSDENGKVSGEKKLCAWRRHACKEMTDYKIFKVFRYEFSLADKNKFGDFVVIGCNDWIQVIAETNNGMIVMVDQYRFGSEKFSLELPGGVIELHENPIEAGRRELAEETGYCGGNAKIISTFYPNPAIQNNRVSVVLIENCYHKQKTNFDEFEDLATVTMTKSELLEAIKIGQISHVITIAAILQYLYL